MYKKKYEKQMKLPLVWNSLSNASGRRCRKTSPNNAPTAKLKRIFKVPPFSVKEKNIISINSMCGLDRTFKSILNFISTNRT